MSGPLIVSLGELQPRIAPSAFVAPGATIVGDVTLEERSSVWYGSVLRGDISSIFVGEGSNIQDLCVLHTDRDYPCWIGARVTVGHGAIVHGARVEDDVLVGMGSILLNGAVIGSGSLVAAGAVVSPGLVVPPGSLVVGVPGRVVRAARDEDTAMITNGPGNYERLAQLHKSALEAG